jgi:hypothetical protein
MINLDGKPLYRFEILAILLMIIASLMLNLTNNDFPLGYHNDEHGKVLLIKEKRHNFNHPVLMLQCASVLEKTAVIRSDQDIAILGRTMIAFFGALSVLFSYCLFRNIINRQFAFITSFAIMISPSMVIHSHYLKEDIVFTCFSILSLYCFIRFLEHNSMKNTILLGISCGLAFSSQYKGLLLFLLFYIFPLIIWIDNIIDYYKKMMLAFILSLITFLIVNYPIFYNPLVFLTGVSSEMEHMARGHDVIISAVSEYFTFHLFKSIVPSITPIITILSLFGLSILLFNIKKISYKDKLLLIYTLLFYFSTETIPLKPYPDYMRYVLPIIPVLVYFCYYGLYYLMRFSKTGSLTIVLYILIATTFIMPVYETTNLLFYIDKDTRARVRDHIDKSEKNIKFETYASQISNVKTLAILNIEEERKKGIRYLVASSFLYDRYSYGVRIGNQEEYIYEAYRRYTELFKYPYVEIKPEFKSFAFSNPTIRIIDIRNPL